MTPADEPLRVVLELAPDREPVEGSVRFAPGETRAFTGWMELVAALQSVLEGVPPRVDRGRAPLNTDKED